MNNNEVKQIIKNWILEISNDPLPEGIIALNFNLYEPYGIELIGAKVYDLENDDWACEEDFSPTKRHCPNLPIDIKSDWTAQLNFTVKVLKELLIELSDINLFQIEHITVGFSDGDLVVIK